MDRRAGTHLPLLILVQVFGHLAKFIAKGNGWGPF